MDPSKGISHWAPTGIKVQHDKEVKEVLVDRVVRNSNQPPTPELLIKWKGLPERGQLGTYPKLVATQDTNPSFRGQEGNEDVGRQNRRGRMSLPVLDFLNFSIFLQSIF